MRLSDWLFTAGLQPNPANFLYWKAANTVVSSTCDWGASNGLGSQMRQPLFHHVPISDQGLTSEAQQVLLSVWWEACLHFITQYVFFSSITSTRVFWHWFTVLHPYFKLAYIEMAWGGAAEQEVEHQKWNIQAKNWHEEAEKVLERTVSTLLNWFSYLY